VKAPTIPITAMVLPSLFDVPAHHSIIPVHSIIPFQRSSPPFHSTESRRPEKDSIFQFDVSDFAMMDGRGEGIEWASALVEVTTQCAKYTVSKSMPPPKKILFC